MATPSAVARVRRVGNVGLDHSRVAHPYWSSGPWPRRPWPTAPRQPVCRRRATAGRDPHYLVGCGTAAPQRESDQNRCQESSRPRPDSGSNPNRCRYFKNIKRTYVFVGDGCPESWNRAKNVAHSTAGRLTPAGSARYSTERGHPRYRQPATPKLPNTAVHRLVLKASFSAELASHSALCDSGADSLGENGRLALRPLLRRCRCGASIRLSADLLFGSFGRLVDRPAVTPDSEGVGLGLRLFQALVNLLAVALGCFFEISEIRHVLQIPGGEPSQPSSKGRPRTGRRFDAGAAVQGRRGGGLG